MNCPWYWPYTVKPASLDQRSIKIGSVSLTARKLTGQFVSVFNTLLGPAENVINLETPSPLTAQRIFPNLPVAGQSVSVNVTSAPTVITW